MTVRVPWVYAAAGDVAEKHEHLTDVMAAPTGPEQRRRLRDSPRIVQSFDTQESRQVRRMMETDLALNGAGLWDVPLVQDANALTAAASLLSTSIAVDTRWCRYAVGGRVLLMGADPRAFEVATIAAIADAALTLEAEPSVNWPAGTWAMPLREGMLESAPSLGRFTGDHGQAQVAFRLTEAIDLTHNAGASVYRTFPVFEIRPDWSRDPDHSYDRAIAYVDNETGPITAYDQPGRPLGQLTLQVSPQGRQATHELRQLLYALGGRWAPFWAPSQAADLLVTGALAAASTTLDIEYARLSAWALPAWRRDIRIELDDGTVLYRRITATADIGANQERLTLDSALGVTRTADQVLLVSFLTLCRQDSDTNVLKFWKGSAEGLAQCELRFRGTADDL